MRLSNFRIPSAVIGLVLMSSVSMTMPVQAINRVACNEGGYMKVTQGDGVMCFANAGEADVVIANVRSLYSGNNAGYVQTNKGIYSFRKWESINFYDRVGTVTITFIRIE
jgi:hypothetical protein